MHDGHFAIYLSAVSYVLRPYCFCGLVKLQGKVLQVTLDRLKIYSFEDLA